MTDRDVIAAHLRDHVYLHLYELGDLDPFFWPSCRFYGARSEAGGALDALCLVYRHPSLPTLLALGTPEQGPALAGLAGRVLGELPGPAYAHVTPEVLPGLASRLETDHGAFLKMALRSPERVRAADAGGTRMLGTGDIAAAQKLYEVAYPGNWFDPRMLATGQYVGVVGGDALVAVAGIHVYSEAQRVAALGNVATHPEHRGQGLARRCVARLCQELSLRVDHIGLNVRGDNAAAIAVYERLGFDVVAGYRELSLGPGQSGQ